MPARLGPFYVFEIAEALAREPGRFKIDEDEAHRIGNHMFGAFERAEFAADEVVVRFGEPSRIVPIARAAEEAQRAGYSWDDMHPSLWYRAAALTYPAAKRYVESCGLASAPRLIGEWFLDAASPIRTDAAAARASRERPTPEKLDLWMRENVRPGHKRDSTMADCRAATGATWRDTLAAWNRLSDALRLKRGQKRKVGKSIT